ncbi:MAG: cation transporter [Methylococcales bacterium]
MHKKIPLGTTDYYESERTSLKVSFIVVLLLMVWGLVFSELTTSNIIEVDAAAYIISGIMGLVTIFVSRLQEKPISDNHPLGYSGFIPILNMIRNLMIIEICIEAIADSIATLIKGPSAPEHNLLFLYTSVTLLFNLSCAIYTQRAAKKLNSPLLKTDALEWKLDTISNISILCAFTLAYVLDKTGYTSYAAYVDPIVCIFFSLYMCINPSKLFFESMQILSIVSIDRETYHLLVATFKKEIPVFRSHTTYFTIFYVAGILWVNVEIHKHKDVDLSVEAIFEATHQCQLIMDKEYPHNKLTYTYSLDV